MGIRTAIVVFLGLLAAVVTGAGGQYLNKYIPGTWGLVRGHLPVSVFGALIFFTILINPLLGLIHRSLRLKAGEIALILGLVLMACGIVDAGMMRYFPRQLVTPIQQERTHPGWQKTEVLKYTPPALLANDGKYDEEVVDNFITAMGEPGKRVIPIAAVPWHAWWKPLTIWTALIALTLVGSLCLAVLVHRQWAEKERIRYPLAEVANALLTQDERGRATILRDRLFWVGLGVPLFIRLVNGIQMWFPKSIAIPLSFDFSALNAKFPEFMKTPGASNFASPEIFPACVGLTFLLASDIGLSLGLSNLFSVGLLFLLIQAGVNLSGSELVGGYTGWQSFGSFLAMGVMLVYIGRRYYWQTAKEAFAFVPQPETEPAGVWSMRLFAICLAGALAILVSLGMDWVAAALAIALTLLTVLVCARVNAECGAFFFAPPWKVAGVVGGLFGMSVLGPKTIILLGMIMYLVQGDIFECLMPFATNSLKIGADAGLKVGRLGAIFGVGLLLAIGVAVPTALWADYNHAAALRRGGDGSEIWSAAERVVSQLDMAGELDKVNGWGTWERLTHMRPEPMFLSAAAVGFVLFLLFSALRLRYTWWPLHPVICLAFGTAVGRFAFSFLLGWLIKTMVSHFGGAQKHTQLKPMMIGLVVGDLAGGFFWMAVSWGYYAIKGVQGAHCPPLW